MARRPVANDAETIRLPLRPGCVQRSCRLAEIRGMLHRKLKVLIVLKPDEHFDRAGQREGGRHAASYEGERL